MEISTTSGRPSKIDYSSNHTHTYTHTHTHIPETAIYLYLCFIFLLIIFLKIQKKRRKTDESSFTKYVETKNKAGFFFII